MKRAILVILALLILLMGTLPVLAAAEEYSSESTEASVSLQQAKPAQKPQPSTSSKVLWLIVVVPSVLVMLGISIAVRVWKHRVWVKYLQDKFGDGDEEE